MYGPSTRAPSARALLSATARPEIAGKLRDRQNSFRPAACPATRRGARRRPGRDMGAPCPRGLCSDRRVAPARAREDSPPRGRPGGRRRANPPRRARQRALAAPEPRCVLRGAAGVEIVRAWSALVRLTGPSTPPPGRAAPFRADGAGTPAPPPAPRPAPRAGRAASGAPASRGGRRAAAAAGRRAS